jgi:hypothetical protein
LTNASPEETGVKDGSHDLDRPAGPWSKAEFQEFIGALREQRGIDPEMRIGSQVLD